MNQNGLEEEEQEDWHLVTGWEEVEVESRLV